jgi:hypothetical protein
LPQGDPPGTVIHMIPDQPSTSALILAAMTGRIFRLPESQWRMVRIKTGKARASFVCQRGPLSMGVRRVEELCFSRKHFLSAHEKTRPFTKARGFWHEKSQSRYITLPVGS